MSISYLKNYYEILEITQDATAAEIKEAYKKSALKYHPDKNKNKNATDLFRDAHDAYEVLKNQETRADYDANYKHPSFALFKEFVTRDITLIEVQNFLDEGASINACNAFSQTILMYAANRFKLEMIDGSGNSALMYAALKENVRFSIDNADIIKERNKKDFENPQEDTEETPPQQKETEEELDITSPPIMKISFPPNILQSLWKSTLESLALLGTIRFTTHALSGIPLKYKLAIVSTISYSVHKEFFDDLELSISSSMYHYSSGYRIEFTSNINQDEQNPGILTDKKIISYVYNFIFGENQLDKQETEHPKEKKQDERTKLINKEKAKITELLVENNSDHYHMTPYGKTALTYAIYFNNIPVMNYFYNLYGMNDKIIPEEDSNEDTDSIIPTSTEIASFESIITLSEANTNNQHISTLKETTIAPNKMLISSESAFHETQLSEGAVISGEELSYKKNIHGTQISTGTHISSDKLKPLHEESNNHMNPRDHLICRSLIMEQCVYSPESYSVAFHFIDTIQSLEECETYTKNKCNPDSILSSTEETQLQKSILARTKETNSLTGQQDLLNEYIDDMQLQTVAQESLVGDINEIETHIGEMNFYPIAAQDFDGNDIEGY
jgi:curved DNA-binding protein CbpA